MQGRSVLRAELIDDKGSKGNKEKPGPTPHREGLRPEPSTGPYGRLSSQQQSLFANQMYRLSDGEPFGERSLVVASDDQWRYVPVRRFTLFVERSVSSSVQSAAFEPNGPALWAAVNSKVTEFLSGLFQSGELKGDRPSQAYFVKCGVETMTESDVANGDLNIVVGFAPLKPAEFVIVAIAATAGPPASDLPFMPRDPPWRWIWRA
jgi:hypothetical protein